MKQTEIIKKLRNDILSNAYRATCCEELRDLNYDAGMMEWHANTYKGKAFEAIELLNFITDSAKGDELFEQAEEEARKDIKAAGLDIIRILDLAGFNGAEYYRIKQMYA